MGLKKWKEATAAKGVPSPSASSQQSYVSATAAKSSESTAYISSDQNHTSIILPEKKFTVVLYGADECQTSTSKSGNLLSCQTFPVNPPSYLYTIN